MLLRNGSILVSGRMEKRDVLIENGIVLKVFPEITERYEEEYDLSGFVIIPGAVDVHSHLREPGFTHKETIKTGTMSAV
ncbi:MAG: dihydroorotase, partial [Clostridia bacterium]